jgi:hypothetical protein|tara:strand:- start:510 stop:782 length:273 start_codon:yes stop_codon:yes gene_type:complete
MAFKDWREQARHVILSPGDMVIDIISNQYGLLIERERRISITDDDVYFWKVTWSSNMSELDSSYASSPIYIEEEGLKLSILIGFYDLYQV